MDIEGGEYPWLLSLNQEKHNKFKQIVIDFHGINDDSWNKDFNSKLQCLKKLSDTHYLIHIHGNNCALVSENGIPDVVELTYIRKDYFSEKPELNKTPFPILGVDFPNDNNRTDYDLNFPPFVN
jgi:hypothetical protein